MRAGKFGCIHFVGPVIDRFLVVYFLPKSVDKGTRRPNFPCSLLFRKHGVQDGSQPIFEGAVIIVRNDKIAYTVHPTSP